MPKLKIPIFQSKEMLIRCSGENPVILLFAEML